MKKLRSFEPISSTNARILILGSMPGARSLSAGQYYAHPMNAFWKIMEEIIGVKASADYEDRIQSLKTHGIALWDVLHSCHREGSLDAAIRSESVKTNDFKSFFQQHPEINTVLFNGATAERYYKRYVAPELAHATTNLLRMPSTSPAHASMPFKQKVSVWSEGLATKASPYPR